MVTLGRLTSSRRCLANLFGGPDNALFVSLLPRREPVQGAEVEVMYSGRRWDPPRLRRTAADPEPPARLPLGILYSKVVPASTASAQPQACNSRFT